MGRSDTACMSERRVSRRGVVRGRGWKQTGQVCRACASWGRCMSHAKWTRGRETETVRGNFGRVLCGGIDRACVRLYTGIHREGNRDLWMHFFYCRRKHRLESIQSGRNVRVYLLSTTLSHFCRLLRPVGCQLSSKHTLS